MSLILVAKRKAVSKKKRIAFGTIVRNRFKQRKADDPHPHVTPMTYHPERVQNLCKIKSNFEP